MLVMTRLVMAVLLVGTIISPAGSHADVHTNDDEDDGSDDFDSVANWKRVISIALFPGCSTFCPGMFMVLCEPIWFSFLAQAGSYI